VTCGPRAEPFGSEPFDELRVSSRVEKLRAELFRGVGGLRYFKVLRMGAPLVASEVEGNREGGGLSAGLSAAGSPRKIACKIILLSSLQYLFTICRLQVFFSPRSIIFAIESFTVCKLEGRFISCARLITFIMVIKVFFQISCGTCIQPPIVNATNNIYIIATKKGNLLLRKMSPILLEPYAFTGATLPDTLVMSIPS
jgi:hypothetical protein